MRRIFIHYIACIILVFGCNSLVAQDVIQQPAADDYAKAVSISGNIITLSEAIPLADHDTVLLVQMKGIEEEGNDRYNAGRYEFHIVSNVSGTTVTLVSDALNFDTDESVQLVHVRSYRNAQVNSTLNCYKWDGEKGGILALMVEGTLTLNADIDVSASGFKGGGISGPYKGVCNSSPPYDQDDYPGDASDRAGYKGEGAITASFTFPRGQGAAFNGGGGGNGKFAGGGGGGNGGKGGKGNVQICGVPATPFDNEGAAIKYGEGWGEGRVFMGGGGGSGTGINTPGGAGGGIVIISAGELRFNNNASIKAGGGTVVDVATQGGAGGGGAGGSVLLAVGRYDGLFSVDISGGAGGNAYINNCETLDESAGSRGAGGGGGGGLLYLKSDALPDNNNINNRGGNFGIVESGQGRCPSQTTSGENAYYLYGLELPLKGFLYNFIITTADTVCYQTDKLIRASTPQGGDGSYEITWQQKAEGDAEWTEVPNSAGKINCQTLPLTKTTTFYRTVKSRENGKEFKDESGFVTITVVPEIISKLDISGDTTVCGNVTSMFIAGYPASGGNGKYAYQWEQNINNAGWEEINGATATGLDVRLQPGEQYYRRIVISDGCPAASSVQIHILPVISGNEISQPAPYCKDTEAEPISGIMTLSGGDTGSIPDSRYRYQWQESDDNQNWNNIAGATGSEYTPGEYIGNRHYRRIVTSGLYDCCISTSNPATVHYDLPPSTAFAGDGQVLHFKFNTALNATHPAVGTGMWTVVEGAMDIEHPNEPSASAINLGIGKNVAQWTVSSGACPSVSATVTVEVLDVDIPSGFSPNGDNINDCFKVIGAENAESSELIIFNRYNNAVYWSKSFRGDSNNCSGWWDGRNSSGKELPSGIYFYQLTLNGNKVYKGYVVLKK